MANKGGILRRIASVFGSGKAKAEPVRAANAVEPKPKHPSHNIVNNVDIVTARYQIGQVVKHRLFPFRGVIYDVDPQFANTDEWYEAIPEEVRPAKDQPYYHLFAENDKTHYVAYVSEQNLLPDETDSPVSHPDIPELFDISATGTYQLKHDIAN